VADHRIQQGEHQNGEQHGRLCSARAVQQKQSKSDDKEKDGAG
jgi:hypothetical protein